ncbi:hypothetical protein F4553_000050 [Allocatelliglobosispora scoriae]|uniref:vWA-MoxR associated protein C-terminal domain-containing protein n=1 Tax=Allocatelliglobosispora scoriae TaxID=643052 RepID=A0A841BIE6_9ACTN|nr:caspase family protein [Allocatelliglobosispora scoriae]MBB5866671.1 hypothetical protein [Allocatelliglobosispora scoriae]
MTVHVAPDRVFVLAVGIEKYAHPALSSLPGAAAEALRVAEWARRCSVPAAQITIACSWADAEGADVEQVHGQRIDLTDEACDTDNACYQQIEPTQEAIARYVVEVAERSGDLLLVFWCGHGVVFDGRRVLFTADADANHLRGMDVEQVLDYLRSVRVAGFGRQVVLIDSCANHLEDVKPDGSWRALVRPANLPSGRNRENVDQCALLSAAPGQTAKFRWTARHAAFSDVVMTWLERPDSNFLSLDMMALVLHVQETFHRLHAESETRQTPVLLWQRFNDSRVSDHFPATVVPPVDVADAGLRLVAEVVADTPMVSDGDGRRLLLRLLGLPAGDDRSAFVAAIAREFAAGRAATIQEYLSSMARNEADRLAVADASHAWHRRQWTAPVLRALPIVSAEQLRAAFFRAMPDANKPPSFLAEALDWAAAGQRMAGRPAPLHHLVAELEHITGSSVPDGWFDLPDVTLKTLRADVAKASEAMARLVVDLRNPALPVDGYAWPSAIAGHLLLPGSDWRRKTLVCQPTAVGVRLAIAELLLWARQRASAFVLGIIAPRIVLDEMPEAWEFGDELLESRPFWRELPTVLHSAERLGNETANLLWKARTEEIRAHVSEHLPDVMWIVESDQDKPANIRDQVLDGGAACLGLEFVTPRYAREQGLSRDPIIAAIAAGAPYIVCLSTENPPPDWPAIRQLVREVAEHGQFDELPLRLHRMRKVVGGPGRELRLIWDEPRALPPIGQLCEVPSGGKDD